MAGWRARLKWRVGGAVLLAACVAAGAGPGALPATGAWPLEVPLDTPSPPPGLDRELAADYRRALAGQGFQVISLVITDRRAAGGMRRVELAYRTRTDGTPSALRPEVVRVIAPSANPRLALDLVAVRAVRRNNTTAATITVSVAALDRWLKSQISDEEFFGRWTVRVGSR